MAIGDVYEVNLKMRLFEQSVYNTFFYRKTASPPGKNSTPAADLCEVFAAAIKPALAGVTSTLLTFSEVRARNLFDEADKATLLITGNGTISTTQAMPGFTVFAVTLQGDNPAVKNGAKRFSGMPEGSQAAGVLEPAALVALGVLENALVLVLKDALTGLINEFAPVIVKRIVEGIKPLVTYRLPETFGEAVTSQIIAAETNLTVSSQTTRKIGRGE